MTWPVELMAVSMCRVVCISTGVASRLGGGGGVAVGGCGKTYYVREDAPYNTHVLTMSATDADDAENGRVVYSLDVVRSTGGGPISSVDLDIDKDSGRIAVR